MDGLPLDIGATYPLPVCSFDAPEGKTFKEWSVKIGDAEAVVKHPNETIEVTANTSVTAVWENLSYTVRFVNEDGTVLQSSEVEYGATPSYTGETPTKAATAQYSYTFNGWNNAIVPVEGPAIYVASYTETRNRYTITFDTDGGSTINPITLDYGAAVTAPADPTRSGFIFRCWNPALPAAMPAKDLTVTAVWVPAFGPASFTLPAAIKTIEESAFEGNPAMCVVYVPDSCTAIGANAFKSCTGLTQIRLPKNCAIDDTAFSGCTSLIAVYAPAGGTTESWANGRGIEFVAEQATG